MLHSVLGPPMYCGPTAICAVTGVDQGDVLTAADRYMRARGRPIVGMHPEQVIGTLALLGYRCDLQAWVGPNGGKPTLAQYARLGQRLRAPRILELTGHYCAVDDAEYICNHTDGLPVSLLTAPHQRYRVVRSFDVTPF